MLLSHWSVGTKTHCVHRLLMQNPAAGRLIGVQLRKWSMIHDFPTQFQNESLSLFLRHLFHFPMEKTKVPLCKIF